jgi:light-regulated signal transduction histidine kinase (bacteriophytochrome)
MGALIDDLLKFSRSGRAALRTEDVDMAQALEEALAPLRAEADGRKIEWSVSSLPTVTGDEALLREVWANLVGNAIKYTSGRSPARIDVGARSGGDIDEFVFFVRDNGVGFDMQFADKLFGVFQRLHAMDEFEGTGIGLASVKRSITRLGGRVWAEAEVGKGATFFFSLPGRKEAAP